MTQPNEQNPQHSQPESSFTGIVASGEAQRSPELREGRDAITDRINGFLESLAFERERDTDITNGGFLLQHSEVITETDLGSDSKGHKHVGIDYRPGISLTGDGKEKPLELQAVLPSAWVEGNEGRRVVTMRGTDPLSRHIHGDHNYDLSRANEMVASFKVEEDQGGIQGYSGYEVHGDGDFRHKFLSDKGVNTGRPVQHLEEVEAAQAELEAAITTIQRALAS